jgi:hypothetical protein
MIVTQQTLEKNPFGILFFREFRRHFALLGLRQTYKMKSNVS